MRQPAPLGVRLGLMLVAMAALLFGGYRVIRDVGRLSGASSKYIADSETRCAYPELYVTRKNEREAGQFIPINHQVRFESKEAALKAGYKQCQN